MNYYQCRNFGIKYKLFFYIDVREYLADKLFLDYKIPIKWTREFSHKDSPYLVIFCKVPKKEIPKFEKAMEDLKNKMLICGHRDYEELCKIIMKEITGGRINEE